VAATPPAASEETDGLPAGFVWNLCVGGAVGVALFAWILYFTDWFPAIGGVLALGGAFSWLAFLMRVMSDDRIKQLQRWTDRRVLCNPRLLTVLVILLVVGLGAATGTATIQVESADTGSPRGVWIGRQGDSLGEPTPLAPGDRVRRVSWHLPGTHARNRVKVSGYPALTVDVHPPGRAELRVPDHFVRPVLVFRPSTALLLAIGRDSMRFVVTLKGRPERWVIEGYNGRTVWIGCDADVDVPVTRFEAWRAELTANGVSHLSHLWRSPIGLPGPEIELTPRQVVDVEIQNADGSRYVAGTFVVARLSQRDAFPQEVSLGPP